MKAIRKRYYEAHKERLCVEKRAYRATHPDKVAETNRKQYAKNSTRLKAASKAYRDAHPEQYRRYNSAMQERRKLTGRDKEYAKRWAKYYATLEASRAVRREERARRRARELAGAAGGITASEWKEIRAAWNGRCAYCEEPGETMDHVIPLSRGGLHDKYNVVPACVNCNAQKAAMLPLNFIWRRAA